MDNFFISKLTVRGDEYTTVSSVSFSKHLTIISGRSNTGKTIILDCIDYIFGGSRNPLVSQPLYTNIELELQTTEGKIIFNRDIESSKIYITSETPIIESGEYSANQAAKNYIGTLLLNLIGIEREVFIIKNQSFSTQRLGWRTFWHLLLTSETEILKEESILLPSVNTQKTAFLSSLIFLLTNEDFSYKTELESDSAKKIRKNSLKKYINNNINQLIDKQNKLKEQEKSIDIKNMPHQIDFLSSEIERINNEIELSTKKTRNLNNKIIENDNNIAETKLLYERYQILLSQYQSDIKRLDFILESDHEHTGAEQTCPFCSNIFIENNDQIDLRKTAEKEITKLMLQVKDLQETLEAVSDDLNNLYHERELNREEKIHLESYIKNTLYPQVNVFEDILKKYNAYQSIKTELEIMISLTKKYQADLNKLETEKTREEKYRPVEEFPVNFFKTIEEYVFSILCYCEFPNLTTVRFDPKTFDVIINNQPKANQGKGYRSFINTVVILAVRKYFSLYSHYKIGPFIIDTPLLGLDDESDTTEINSNMSSLLYEYIIESRKLGQLIIVENTQFLPDINYDHEGINNIVFTKDSNVGRYGFLQDISE
ncbi:AAA family ATPase [Facklamia languida]